MNNLFKEITQEEALKMNPDNVIVIKPSQSGRNVVYTLDEILKDSKFFRKIEESVQLASDTAEKPNSDDTETSNNRCEILDNHESSGEKSKRKIDVGKIYALRDAGWKIKDIAEECRCSIATVANYLKKRPK